MPRRLLVTAVWMVAVVSVVIAIGMQVRRHRLADPVQTLRQYLPWVPDDLGGLSSLICRDQRPDGLVLQFEVRGRPVDVARFAARNGMSRIETPLQGSAPIARWQLVGRERPDLTIHLSVPSDGGPALILIIDGGSR